MGWCVHQRYVQAWLIQQRMQERKRKSCQRANRERRESLSWINRLRIILRFRPTSVVAISCLIDTGALATYDCT